MRVTAWNGGGNTYGLYIGIRNRNLHFKREWRTVTIELEGQAYTFVLTNGFWRNCPEIRDRGTPHIREWLARHRTLTWPRGRPPAIQLEPTSDSRYRLVP